MHRAIINIGRLEAYLSVRNCLQRSLVGSTARKAQQSLRPTSCSQICNGTFVFATAAKGTCIKRESGFAGFR